MRAWVKLGRDDLGIIGMVRRFVVGLALWRSIAVFGWVNSGLVGRGSHLGSGSWDRRGVVCRRFV
jgi:hypothetical protein